MTFYMLELGVTDLARAIAWYVAHLPVVVTRTDPACGFVLLEGAGCRLALKQHPSPSTGVLIHFEVKELLPDQPIKASDEGYLRQKLSDPDGNTIILFQWQKAPASSDSP
ncbi:MAG: VOC family protein [Gemmataceae bacterium]